MKPITLHPVSVLVGLVLGGALIGLAAAQSPGSVQSIPVRDVRLVGEIPAEWWVFVELENVNGVPVTTYTVPAGHSFVVTQTIGTPWIHADGQPIGPLLGWDTGAGITALGDTRVPLGPGTLLTNAMPSSSSTSRMWGYLEPLR